LIIDLKKQRFIDNNGTTGGAAYKPQKRTIDDSILELQQHRDTLGDGGQ
jgi:hypothetical protein